MPSRIRLSVTFLLAALAIEAPSARPQEQWTWPEKSKNLQVLPKDFGAEGLQAVMKGFSAIAVIDPQNGSALEKLRELEGQKAP